MDSDLLHIAGVSMELLRHSKFSSYILVLNLVSSHTVEKILAPVDAG